MNPLPSIASSNVADLLSKHLPTIPHHQYSRLFIGDIPTAPTTSVDTPPVVASPATVATPTVVASTVDPLTTTVTTTSDSVPTSVPTLVPAFIHPNPVPYFVDTGASFPTAPAVSDYLSVATSVASKVASAPVDPYTLITGEDATTADLSSPDLFGLDSNSVDTFEFASAFEVLELREFGTATLIFISNPHSESELETILVEPTLDWTDTWFDWIPLPRLILSESYFHIFGLDYLQAFTLFHLIPIWIYCLLHFGLE